MSEEKAAVAPADAPPVPEPTGPGTAVAAQEQLKSTEPKPTLLGEKPPEAKPPEAPAAFEAEKITFPEGFQRNDELFGQFTKIAKDNGLTQPVAQQLSDLYVTAAKQFSNANLEAWNTTKLGWETEVKGNEELAKATLKTASGNTLTGLEAVKATIAKVIDDQRFSYPGVREFWAVTGAGSHPAYIVPMYRMAKALTEGQAVQGEPSDNAGKRTTEPVSAAKALYPNNP